MAGPPDVVEAVIAESTDESPPIQTQPPPSTTEPFRRHPINRRKGNGLCSVCGKEA